MINLKMYLIKCIQICISKSWRLRIQRKILIECIRIKLQILLMCLKLGGIKCKTNMIKAIKKGLKNRIKTSKKEWSKLRKRIHSQNRNMHYKWKMKSLTKNFKSALLVQEYKLAMEMEIITLRDLEIIHKISLITKTSM